MKVQNKGRGNYVSPMASIMMLNVDAICSSDLMGTLLVGDDIGGDDIFISGN